jgi:hypothetical protein
MYRYGLRKPGSFPTSYRSGEAKKASSFK